MAFQVGLFSFFLFFSLLFINCSHSSSDSPAPIPYPGCTTLLCTASKYSLLIANVDGSNVTLLKTSDFQDMTHPRVSSDKNWLMYTTYNNRNDSGCATHDQAYLNTELRAVKLDGTGDKTVVGPVDGKLNSNSYWIGATNEFTYLSGPPSSLKFYRSTVDSNMNITSGPLQIPVVGTIVPMDPATNAITGKIAFPGLYNPGGGFVKSIFIMNLADSSDLVGLSVGRDHANNLITCADAQCENIMENDPKISPDGTKVAFMRRAPSSGGNSFGWHLFVVSVASPLAEVDISYSHLGADLFKNDVLPEWISNTKLIFSTIEIVSSTEFYKNVFTMNADGSERQKIDLPEGFRYADVFPFTDSNGHSKLILSAEKIEANCTN